MILGIGNDITGISRVDRMIQDLGQKFLDRIFTPKEQELSSTRSKKGGYYAKRFSAKEACIKALGTGLRENIRWTDIEITNAHNGKPLIELSGAALDVLKSITPKGQKAVIHLSLSDDMDLAQSFVVISTEN